MKKIIHTSNAPQPVGPYSQAVMTNNTLFVSGQIPLNPASKEMVKGDIKDQTRQVMENLKAILKEAGLEFSDVVKCSIFLTDMKNFPHVNAVYGEYFTEEPPARETIQVSGLPLGADVEISCIAVI